MNNKKFKSMTKRDLLSYVNEVVIGFITMRISLLKLLEDGTVKDDMKRGLRASIFAISDCAITVLKDMDNRDLIEDRIKEILPALIDEREYIKQMIDKKKTNTQA